MEKIRGKMKNKYFLSAPDMGENELKNIHQAFEDNWIAPLGPFVSEFEKRTAEMVKRKFGVAMCSGTAAIHIALKQLGVKEGDVVFCSSLTFIGSSNPILYEKAKPVFIDSEEETWCICPVALEKAIIKYSKVGKLPKAIIVVSLFGTNPKWDEIILLSQKYNIPILEDSAESFGAYYKGRPSGSFGEYSVLSFNGNKIITTSGGGVLLTNSDEDAKHALKLITQARDQALYYLHSEIGYNFRMSNICAAIGCGQLDILSKRVEKKTHIYRYYKQALSKVKGISFNPYLSCDKPNHWLTAIRLDRKIFGKGKNLEILEKLNELNIEVRPIWKPMHTQPIYIDCDFVKVDRDISAEIFEDGLCLPSWTKLEDEDLDFIVENISRLLR
jgi:pyridoxal phosphate-dependent aminotransferase EpsN